MNAQLDIADSDLPTEEKILLAASRLFSMQGYAATTTRDIANAAGVNIATLHYYHRKKDQLFSVVARKSMHEFAEVFNRAFTRGTPLKQKIRDFVDGFIDLFIDQPHLAMFCLTESERNPQAFGDMIDFRHAHNVMEEQLGEMIELKEIQPISTQCFISALVGMTIYPFLTKTSILHTGSFSEDQFKDSMEEHREMIPAMITSYLFVNQ